VVERELAVRHLAQVISRRSAAKETWWGRKNQTSKNKEEDDETLRQSDMAEQGGMWRAREEEKKRSIFGGLHRRGAINSNLTGPIDVRSKLLREIRAERK